jgi:hypothetical protein
MAASSGKEGCHVTGDHMAKILAFRPVELKRVESGVRARRSAEVIFFPGVRYERWNDRDGQQMCEDAATTKRAGGRQRDILELAE